MILTKTVEIRIVPKHIKFWKEKGYDVNINDIITVNLSDISKNSNVLIDVLCENCGKLRRLSYQKYNMSKEKYGIYTCKDCGYDKSKQTLQKNFGVEYTFLSEDIRNKIKATWLERYGVDNCAKCVKIYNKIKTTNYISGRWLKKDEDEFSEYCRNIRNITNKNKKILFENWDGKDYYDGEYIRDNFLLESGNKDYPTIDHKMSVSYGFKNGILPEEIGKLENLCITKRTINSRKYTKCEK
jgi:hypothetical protein